MEGKEEIEWSRWQPTKRQKEILEELFKEGHRNPSPSLIDHFTNLLKQYGNIEAKNVFYWFQNNHARNKRKQEKETHADNKRKQKKEARQMPQSRFVSTPRGLNDKDSVKILEGQTKGKLYLLRFLIVLGASNLVVFLSCSHVCLYAADRTIVDSSKGMAEFSAQVKRI
jgi:hypothetical protein